MTESWEAFEHEREVLVPLNNRIELMAVYVGVGDTSTLVDPEHETVDQPAGVENIPLVTLDLMGHLHQDGRCIPARTPFLITSLALDQLIEGLLDAQKQMDARYPHRERAEQ